MKQQDYHFSLKNNFTTKDLNTCTEEEIPNNEFQKTIVQMIIDLKEGTQKLVFDLKEDKQLNDLKRI
jgi:hypothetical protein